MDQNELVARVWNHADNAKLYQLQRRDQETQKELVELRELLIEQPELEAGGEQAPDEQPASQPQPFKSP